MRDATMHPVNATFLDRPASQQPVSGSVSIFGAVHGTPYGEAAARPAGRAGPDLVREAIADAALGLDHWDFDFDGPLLDDGALQVFDLGDVATFPDAAAANRTAIAAATREIRAARSVPILIGGDDSVAIPYMSAFADADAVHVLQIDAHIDWREDIGGERFGYSSTMRRASEIASIRSMTQVGIRAVGSARRAEVETARVWGSRLVTVREARRRGMEEVAATIPLTGELLIHIDCDALDPSICPGVNAPSPGGLSFDEVTDLLKFAMVGRRLAGFSVVEFAPERDVNGLTALVVGRLVCHILGYLARQTGG